MFLVLVRAFATIIPEAPSTEYLPVPMRKCWFRWGLITCVLPVIPRPALPPQMPTNKARQSTLRSMRFGRCSLTGSTSSWISTLEEAAVSRNGLRKIYSARIRISLDGCATSLMSPGWRRRSRCFRPIASPLSSGMKPLCERTMTGRRWLSLYGRLSAQPTPTSRSLFRALNTRACTDCNNSRLIISTRGRRSLSILMSRWSSHIRASPAARTPKISRMSYPAARSERDSVLQGQTSTVRGYLSSYFDAGRFGYDGAAIGDHVWSKVDRWLEDNGVSTSALFVTEMGCHGDTLNASSDMPGASVVARAKWFQDNSSVCAARGVSRTYWSYGGDRNVWNFCQNGIPDPAILASFGNPCPAHLFEPETRQLIARMSRPPSAARQTHLNAVVRLLKLSDLWMRLDAFYLFGQFNAAHRRPEQDAMLNFLGPRFDCRQFGAGEWRDDVGFASDGLGGFLDTGLAPGVSGNSAAAQDFVCLALRRSGPWPNTGAPAALASDGLQLALQPRSLSARCFDDDGPASLGISTFSITDVTIAASRVSPEGWAAYFRGSRAFRGAELCPEILRASGAPNAVSIKIGRPDLSRFSGPDQFHRCAAIGAGLKEPELRALTTIMDFAVDGLAMMG